MCKATKCYKSAKVGGAKHSLVEQNGKLVGQPPHQLYKKLHPCRLDAQSKHVCFYTVTEKTENNKPYEITEIHKNDIYILGSMILAHMV